MILESISKAKTWYLTEKTLFHNVCKHYEYQWCCGYCQEDKELGRGNLLDNSGPQDKAHSWGSCQSSAVLAPLLHLGRNNPANINLDKNTQTL